MTSLTQRLNSYLLSPSNKWVPYFYKAKSWLVNVLAPLIVCLPDIINLVLANWTMVDTLPTLSAGNKVIAFIGLHYLAAYFRTRKQPNMPTPTVPVAVVNVPETVDVMTSSTTSVPVATEIHEVAARDALDLTRTHL